MLTKTEIFGYEPTPKYSKAVAYFSMEFAVDQALKIYSGGLGFLAGSHLRSAYELKQNLVGIGILWKYGYYDQVRDQNGTMKPSFIEKFYSFLTDTGIIFSIPIHNVDIHVKAYLLKPEVFGSAPLFLLSTDIPENDFLSSTICDKLYDPNEATRIAQSILLGIGGAKLMDLLNMNIDIYHMNEGHSVALNFYLYAKYKSLDEIKKRVVFTTHTPEKAGNEEHRFEILKEMSFFYHLQDHEVKHILGLEGDMFDYTLAALKCAKISNGVSKLHGVVAAEMWSSFGGISKIISITNSQNKKYWEDPQLEIALAKNDDKALIFRKKELKRELFQIVANQTGKLFDENTLTIVWARRFAGYKRADLMMKDFERFLRLINKQEQKVQLIWAGKPYPEDYASISIFNNIFAKTRDIPNCAVLVGYELELSAYLKKGSDVWLNNPRMFREASGTSGMSAAMNGSVNFSIPDGWVPEFAKHKENCFVIPAANMSSSIEEQNEVEALHLMDILENEVIPMYYSKNEDWLKIVKQAMKDVIPQFESGRMVDEYYVKMYN
jgi:starch phosphorylase